MRVLAIDDEPDMLMVVERALTRAGHEVTGLPNAVEALDAARLADYDVAVVDYSMPTMNGLEFLERLRTIQPGCPGILASGRLDLSALITAVNRGDVFRVLEKPFDGAELLAATQDVMEHRRRLAKDSEHADTMRRERAQLNELLSSDLFRLAVQPIVNAQTGRPAAYEALMRSTHPILRGPLEILEAAERLGHLEAVADAVARRAAEWVRRIPEPIALFINLHPAELNDQEALRRRIEPLSPYASRIVYEITERSRLADNDGWYESIELLRSHGFRLAVDDLGAGYSSLSVLAEVKPCFLKVDMSIIRGIDADPHKQRLAQLLCDFARATGACLVAEGVETEQEATTLETLGAHLLQGYRFGRPSFELLA